MPNPAEEYFRKTIHKVMCDVRTAKNPAERNRRCALLALALDDLVVFQAANPGRSGPVTDALEVGAAARRLCEYERKQAAEAIDEVRHGKTQAALWAGI